MALQDFFRNRAKPVLDSVKTSVHNMHANDQSDSWKPFKPAVEVKPVTVLLKSSICFS